MNETKKQSLREQGHRLTVTTEELQALLGCGRKSAVEMGELAGAKIQFGKRVLWNVEKIRGYLNRISV